MQQPDQLTSDLHRPDTTLWPAPVTFIDLAGLATLVGALWATRQAFGANLSHVGTLIWACSAGGIIIIAILLFILTSRTQNQAEDTLRRLFDPDVQGMALGLLEGRSFGRQGFREALWYSATKNRRGAPRLLRPLLYAYRRGRILHQMDELEPYALDPAEPQPRKRDLLGSYWEVFNPRYEGTTSLLSTVDLVDALDDGAQLAIGRFLDMKAIASGHFHGMESFRVID